jgi:SAM-dependent methyltransferase
MSVDPTRFDAEADRYLAERYPKVPRGFEQHAYARRRALALALLDDALPRPGTVLDVGCGPGVLCAPLLDRGHEVVALDASARMLTRARAVTAAHPRATHVRFVHANAASMPCADRSIEAVVCLGVVSYVDDDAALLREIARVLGHGGVAIVQWLRAGAPLQLERGGARALSRALYSLAGRTRPAHPAPVARDVDEVIEHARAAGLTLEREKPYDFRPVLLHRLWPGNAARVSAAAERLAAVPRVRALSAAVVCRFRRS